MIDIMITLILSMLSKYNGGAFQRPIISVHSGLGMKQSDLVIAIVSFWNTKPLKGLEEV